MDFYHHHVNLVRRSKGQNAIASAAYIAGICLEKLDGSHADYRQKRGVCGHKIILPSKYADMPTPTAQELWKLAESTDNRKNSITARRADLALPKDFTKDECLEVGYKYAQDLTDRYNVVTQIDFHALETNNPHIDMQFTTREFDGEKLVKKTRVLDEKQTGVDEIKWMREQFAKRINEVLAKYGKQVDHRSYKDQGLEKLPQKHLGRKCTALERKGISTDRSTYNDKVREYNKLIEEKNLLNQEIVRLKAQLKENDYVSKKEIRGVGREQATLGTENNELGWARGKAQTPSYTAGSRNCNEVSTQCEEPRKNWNSTSVHNDINGINRASTSFDNADEEIRICSQQDRGNTETAKGSLQQHSATKGRNEGLQEEFGEFCRRLQVSHRIAQKNGGFYSSYRKQLTSTRNGYGQDADRYIQSIEQLTKRRGKTTAGIFGCNDNNSATTGSHEQAFKQFGKIFEITKHKISQHGLLDVSKLNDINSLIPQLAEQVTMQHVGRHLKQIEAFNAILAKPFESSQLNLSKAKDISKLIQSLADNATNKAIVKSLEVWQTWAFMDNITLAPPPPMLVEHEQDMSKIITKLADHATAKGIRKILHKARYEQRVAYHQDKIRAQLEAMQQAIEQPKITLLDEVVTPPQQETIKIEQKSYTPSSNTEHDNDREYNDNCFKPR